MASPRHNVHISLHEQNNLACVTLPASFGKRQVSMRNIYEEVKRENSIWFRGMTAKLNIKDQHEYQ